MNSFPGRPDARSQLAIFTSSFSFPMLRSFVCEGPNVAETIYRLLSCSSCRGQTLAEQLTNLSRERAEAENVKKQNNNNNKRPPTKCLPICQEHGKSCCIFCVGGGLKARRPGIWLTSHRKLQNTEAGPYCFSLGTQGSSQE